MNQTLTITLYDKNKLISELTGLFNSISLSNEASDYIHSSTTDLSNTTTPLHPINKPQVQGDQENELEAVQKEYCENSFSASQHSNCELIFGYRLYAIKSRSTKGLEVTVTNLIKEAVIIRTTTAISTLANSTKSLTNVATKLGITAEETALKLASKIDNIALTTTNQLHNLNPIRFQEVTNLANKGTISKGYIANFSVHADEGSDMLAGVYRAQKSIDDANLLKTKLANDTFDGSGWKSVGSRNNPLVDRSLLKTNNINNPFRNKPTTINNRLYSKHALDHMQNEGITPTMVEGAISQGVHNSQDLLSGTKIVDNYGGLTVVINDKGGVITVFWSSIK